jgi:hypothetical protein
MYVYATWSSVRDPVLKSPSQITCANPVCLRNLFFTACPKNLQYVRLEDRNFIRTCLNRYGLGPRDPFVIFLIFFILLNCMRDVAGT